MAGVELHPATLSLDALAAAASQHEAPPSGLCFKYPFKQPLGGIRFEIDLRDPIDGGSDHWLGGWLYWGGAKEAAPVGVPFALELATAKADGSSDVLRRLAGHVMKDAWKRGCGWGFDELCKWSQLRRAVRKGCSLWVIVVALPPSEPAALGATLKVPGSPASTLATLGGMLDGGPFTDVAVSGGGRTFRAHRIVLATASPVFLRMLDGGMREAREAAVELVGADASAVALLLRHVYGGAIEVPVSLALQLYALADQYQLASGLQECLRLGLMALQLAPEALCELAPAARTLCPLAFTCNIRGQGAKTLGQLSPLPAFAGWPADAVVEVMSWATPLAAFKAAVAWMEAQPNKAKRPDTWPRLLRAAAWSKLSSSDLAAVRQHPGFASVPGLAERVADACLALCARLEAEAAAKPQQS
jgi:hypothetical protein